MNLNQLSSSHMKVWPWIGGSVAGMALIGLGWSLYEEHAGEVEHQRQLQLARAEGIPTTGDELRAQIPKVAASENAAPDYVKGVSLTRKVPFKESLPDRLTFTPSEEVVKEAEAALTGNQTRLDLIDDAITYPHCSFDRDWDHSATMLLPEPAAMRAGAKLLVVRGSLAAYRGKSEEAMKDFRGILKIANHAREDPGEISNAVGEGIASLAQRALRAWAFKYPQQPSYLSELRSFANSNRPSDHVYGERSNLLFYIDLIKSSQMESGRKELGLREQNPGTRFSAILHQFLPQSRGKALIVRGQREFIAALKQGLDPGLGAVSSKDFDSGFSYFPYVAEIVNDTGQNRVAFLKNRDHALEAQRMLDRALIRILSLSKLPTSYSMTDLISPITGKPLVYTSDGKTIKIEAGQAKNFRDPMAIELPPKNLSK